MTVVVVTWILVLMAAFGLNHTRDVLNESRSVELEIARHQLLAWAWSGVELAMATLEQTPPVETADLDGWGPDNPLAGMKECGHGRFAVGEIVSFDGVEQWRPGIRDEAARLPLAVADSIALSLIPGLSKRGVETILQSREIAGEHRPPPFAMLDLDETSLTAAQRYLSRYGDAVNVNSASAEILEAVGLPETAVDKLLGWRAGRDRMLGTGDDQHFLDLDSDSQAIRDCGLNSEEAAVLALLRGSGRLAVTSRFFRLASFGWGDGMDGICRIRAIIERPDEEPIRVVEWSEHWLN